MTPPPSKYQAAIYASITDRWDALIAHRRRFSLGGPRPRNLMVVAGPGSGKSHTLREACRVIPSANVEVISFSKRVATDAAGKLPSNAQSVTLHAVGKRALQTFFGRKFAKAGEGMDAAAGDGELAENKMHRIVARLKELGEIDRYVPGALVVRLVRAAKGAGLVPRGAVVGKTNPMPVSGLLCDEGRDDAWRVLMERFAIDAREPGKLVAAARTALMLSIQSAGACIDFDDMPYMPTCLPGMDFTFGVNGRPRDVVMVDELQDLDAVQRRLIRLMSGEMPGSKHSALFVGVGDPRQAIFQWRGAAQDSMDLCATDMRCDTLPLSVCYRCPELHITLANEESDQADGPLIEPRPDCPEGEIVNFADGTVDGSGPMVDLLTAPCADCLPGKPCADFPACGPNREPIEHFSARLFQPGDAVICRTNAPLVSATYWLMRARVPCRLVGRDFGRQLTSLVESTGVVGADRMIEVLEAKLKRRQAADEKDRTLDGEPSEEQVRLRESVEVLRAVVENLAVGLDREAPVNPDADPVDTGAVTVREVLNEIGALFGDLAGDGSDCVTLISIHRAKGGEWPRVWACDLDTPARRPAQRDDRPQPSWRAREERNLRFVAHTRSQGSLYFFRSDML